MQAFKDEKVKSEIFVKSLFQELVTKVFLFPDHITLVYNLKNNPAESITLDELLNVESSENRINTDFMAIKKLHTKSVKLGLLGSPSRTRTYDALINSQVFYRLNYRGIC